MSDLRTADPVDALRAKVETLEAALVELSGKLHTLQDERRLRHVGAGSPGLDSVVDSPLAPFSMKTARAQVEEAYNRGPFLHLWRVVERMLKDSHRRGRLEGRIDA